MHGFSRWVVLVGTPWDSDAGMVGFEQHTSTSENAPNGSKRKSIPPSQNKRLKRMARDTGDGDQSKKRKKWIENLSVLLSEDEEPSHTSTTNEKENRRILGCDKAIYLRFPYYMGSDDSDEDGIKCFPDISSKKKDVKSLYSSSDDSQISKENHSYKHTKRKQRLVKKRVEKKVREKSTNSVPPSSKSKKHAPALKRDGNMKETHKVTSLKQRGAYDPKNKENVVKEEKSYSAQQKEEEFQITNPNSNRFLDSSSESSGKNIFRPKTKKRKFRRVQVISTSSSNSDGEGDVNNTLEPQNPQQSENDCSLNVETASSSKPNEYKPKASLSSEDEDEIISSLNPLHDKNGNMSKLDTINDPELPTHSVGVSSNFPRKTILINALAWKSIAIADIKAQHNKQSKVEELKKKLAPSNASSIAIYKKIQKREMLRNKPTPQRPISRPKPSSFHQTISHNTENTSCPVKYDNLPSTSTSQNHYQNHIDSTLKKQIAEKSDSKNNCELSLNLDIQEREENPAGEGVNAHSSKTESLLESSPLDGDSTMPMYGKKIRQAHNSGPKSQDPSKSNQTKISTQRSKKMQFSKENHPKESKQISNETSTTCDVLGNIMSQMDKNRYKIIKPANKKTEPTSDALGWFPAVPNTSSSSNPVQNMTNLQQPRIDEYPLKHSLPGGIALPTLNAPTVVNQVPTQRTVNPSYNPLSSTMASSNNTIKTMEKDSVIRLNNLESRLMSRSIGEVSRSLRMNENPSTTSSAASFGEKIVPFYSAPQEDYESSEFRLKNLNTNTKKNISKTLSESKTENQIISHNSKPQSDKNESNMRPLEGLSNNPTSQEPTVSQSVHSNILSNHIPTATTTKVSSKIINNQLQENTHNSDKNISVGPLKITMSQPQNASSSEVTRSNGEMSKGYAKQFKALFPNINPHNSDKNIRVEPLKFTTSQFTMSQPQNPSSSGVTRGNGEMSEGFTKQFKTLFPNINPHNSDKIIRVEPLKFTSSQFTMSQPQNPSSSEVTRGNGEISEPLTQQFKKLSPNVSVQMPTKGVRVRVQGTEYRVPKKTDNLNTKDGEISEKQSQADLPVPTSSPDVSCVSAITDEFTRIIDNSSDLENEKEETPAKPVSSSSTTNTSSSSDSSSSSDDSSSESSDESGKPSSTEGSSSGISDSRASSPKLNASKRLHNRSPLTKNIQAQISSQENTQVDSKDITLQQVQNSIICSSMKDKTASNQIEVITLSSSSDSDSNSQLQYKEIESQPSGQVLKRKEHSNTVVDPMEELDGGRSALQVEKMNTVIHSEEELNDGSNDQQADKSNENSNKVGKIRVKSLKELGVVIDNSRNENALQVTETKHVSQAQSKEQSNREVDTPSCSTSNVANVANDNSIDKPGFNVVQQANSFSHQVPLRMPAIPKLFNSIIVKNPSNPATSVFLPVVPIAVINPRNAVRVRPITSNLNKEKIPQIKEKESNLDTANQNSSNIETTVPSQTTASGSAILNNQVIPLVKSAVASTSENVERFFFNLCDELFTDVVLFKMPKLADDLHLLIAYDITKEEHLKKIDQLLSTETIASEKRRVEKEYNEMVKVRSHSFVPLFMTIVNKIDKKNVKALFTAVYCRIVHRLEQIDPINRRYRFKIRHLIKSMLQRHMTSWKNVSKEIITYLEPENESSFVLNFSFIEDLLRKYDSYVVERQTTEMQNRDNASVTSPPAFEVSNSQSPTGRINEDTDSSPVVPSADSSTQSNTATENISNETASKGPNVPEPPLHVTERPPPHVPERPPPPMIGNLDELFFK